MRRKKKDMSSFLSTPPKSLSLSVPLERTLASAFVHVAAALALVAKEASLLLLLRSGRRLSLAFEGNKKMESDVFMFLECLDFAYFLLFCFAPRSISRASRAARVERQSSLSYILLDRE